MSLSVGIGVDILRWEDENGTVSITQSELIALATVEGKVGTRRSAHLRGAAVGCPPRAGPSLG